MYLRLSLASALIALDLVPRPNPIGGEPTPQRLVLIEQFRSTGDEPFFWTTEIQSRATRESPAEGGARYTVLLERLDAAYGAYAPVRFIPTSGVEPMQLVRSATGEIDLPANGTLETFANRLLASASQSEPNPSVNLFGASISSLLPEVTVATEMKAEALLIGKTNTTLHTFSTPEVGFAIGEVRVRMRYRGFALIDAARTQLFHAGFVQEGSIESEGKRSQVAHSVFLFATDLANEPLIPARADPRLEALVIQFASVQQRPDAAPMRPDVAELSQLPGWTTPVWISGRVANASLGIVAERATNPLPLLTLGSLVLTDTALDFTGNLIWDAEEIRAGRRDEVGGTNALDSEIPSPLAAAYGASAPLDTQGRFALFRDGQTKGASSYGASVFALGTSLEVALSVLGGTPQSSLVSFASTVGTDTTSAGGMAGVGSGTGAVVAGSVALGVIGLSGLAAVVAGSSEGGGSGNWGSTTVLSRTYQGTWSGNCQGQMLNGAFAMDLNSKGRIGGDGFVELLGAKGPIVGEFTKDGIASGTVGGVTWNGHFSIQGGHIAGSGSWKDNVSGCSGMWQTN